MEIGSFIELQFPRGLEYYGGDEDIIRLNSGRAAIWHAFRLTGCRAIWLPYYQCDTVRDFLKKKGAAIRYYHIDREFNPLDLKAGADEAVLFVNYYGTMSRERMRSLADGYCHAIIDNSQAFFCEPLPGCLNVYSARKFAGVPDGAYVIGANAGQYSNEYEQCYSSNTASFLLQRIEYGCEGKTYESRMVNEHRIDSEDIMLMSKLTRTLLDGTDYELIRTKRRENYRYAHELFSGVNRLDAMRYYDEDCVPMVYPLIVEDDGLLGRLLEKKHFQGHWWSYLLDEMPEDTAEYWISRYIIPITIDQRYGFDELEYIKNVVLS